MLRQIHSLAGLLGALLLALMGITGAVLSVDPALDRLDATAQRGVTVAQVLGRVSARFQGVEQVQRTASGTLLVFYSNDAATGAVVVDPVDGKTLAPYAPSQVSRWTKQLHRSLFLDTPGRLATGAAALVMAVLCVSGLLLLVKRVGGLARLIAPLHGNRSQRWHAEGARLAVAGLLLSALTGAYMSAATLELISDGAQAEPDFPARTAGGPPLQPSSLDALKATPFAELRELVFPMSGDPSAVYTLRTTHGDGYIDQSTGALLVYRPHGNVRLVFEWMYRLHTGEGLWWLGLLLGMCALAAPWLAGTGVVVWWQRQRAKPRLRGNSSAQSADSVILVGSENNSTWGFARVLQEALRHAGQRVHCAPMNQLAARYGAAQHLFLLTSTYGNGEAPTSANQFLARLGKLPAQAALRFSVLGFGDRQFPKFCQFAQDVDAAMSRHGWQRALPLAMIDRQSPQEFARWGLDVGALLGLPIVLEHTPVHPPTIPLRLHERVDYGPQESEPSVVLRFSAARSGGRRRLPAFEAGDLVGIMPPGSAMPRFYSLASSARDGVLEICVRRQPGGICSTYLHGLKLGEEINAFIQPNPQFRPASGKAPVILIGAGTGIGPLAGFVRHNTGKYPMYLYWGGRNPETDFLYEPELRNYLADRRLTQLHTAFSRVENGQRVQSRLIDDAENLRGLVRDGAQVLVCGSSAMAVSVRQALNEILAPLRLDVEALRSTGRYREDVF